MPPALTKRRQISGELFPPPRGVALPLTVPFAVVALLVMLLADFKALLCHERMFTLMLDILGHTDMMYVATR